MMAGTWTLRRINGEKNLKGTWTFEVQSTNVLWAVQVIPSNQVIVNCLLIHMILQYVT